MGIILYAPMLIGAVLNKERAKRTSLFVPRALRGTSFLKSLAKARNFYSFESSKCTRLGLWPAPT